MVKGYSCSNDRDPLEIVEQGRRHVGGRDSKEIEINSSFFFYLIFIAV